MKKMSKFLRGGMCVALTAVMVFAVVSNASAWWWSPSPDTTSCQTKYPIILVHGMGFISTDVYPNSFPGIVEALEARGATVYCTNVAPIASTREKAEQFKEELLKIMAIDDSPKFNIIGHSHGGVYTRDAISNLGMAPYVASHTSVDSPQRGSTIAQTMVDIANIFPPLAEMMLGMIPFAGDQDKMYENISNLSSNYMNNVFNKQTPNMPGIYYQSWTGAFRHYSLFYTLGYFLNALMQSLSGSLDEPSTPQEYVAAMHKAFPALATEMWLLFAGYNDGLVPVNSAKWGTFRGTEFGSWWSYGVDHIDMVNLNPNGVSFDVIGEWVELVQNLKNKGY